MRTKKISFEGNGQTAESLGPRGHKRRSPVLGVQNSLLFWSMWLVLPGLMILALAAFPSRAGAQDISEGEQLFTSKGCTACHTIGGGDLVGPDLAGVTTRTEKDWLARWLKEPDKMLAEGDATATELFEKYNKVPMPNLGLTDAEVASLIAYFESLDSGGTTAPTSSAVTLPAGDAERGKAFFVGTTRFSGGGPACMACHSVAGIGALGGGNLGPDLTTSGYIVSETAFATFISAPTTQTMSAVWKGTPLTEQEQADLYAFLGKASVAQREPSALTQIAMLSGGTAIVLIALAQIWWRKRLAGVRRPMVERAQAKSSR